MHRKSIFSYLEEYKKSPLFTTEEAQYYTDLQEFIKNNPRCFERNNPGHITGSAWLINQEGTHTLLTHHKKLGKWFQLGGHADGETDIAAVALQEAHEESGIDGIEFVQPGIFDIDIHAIPNNCIAHYDVRFLLRAPHGAEYIVSDESQDLAWVPIEEITNYAKERSVLRMAEKMGCI